MSISSPTDPPSTSRSVALMHAWWRSRLGAQFLIELGLVVGLLSAYRLIRSVSRADLVIAFENAADVIRFEGWLGLAVEDDLQRLLLEHTPIIKALNLYYVVMHFPAAIALLVWLFIFHPDRYRPIRNLMTAVTFSALIIHVLYPLAPPRMMADFVDTMAVFGPNIYPPNALEGAANQIAAMPSLHFGWAAIEAIAVVWVLSTRWRWLAVIHPVLMTLAIVGTGNHWWMDAAVAGMLIVLSIVLGKLIAGAIRSRRSASSPSGDGGQTIGTATTAGPAGADTGDQLARSPGV